MSLQPASRCQDLQQQHGRKLPNLVENDIHDMTSLSSSDTDRVGACWWVLPYWSGSGSADEAEAGRSSTRRYLKPTEETPLSATMDISAEYWNVIINLFKDWVKATLWPMVSRLVSLGVKPRLGPKTRFCYCQSVAVLSMWGALSDDRMCLPRSKSVVHSYIARIFTILHSHSVLKSPVLCG
jgi:hypothetical protein